MHFDNFSENSLLWISHCSVTLNSPFLPVIYCPGSTMIHFAFSGSFPKGILDAVKVYIFNLFLPWKLSYSANDCLCLEKLGGFHIKPCILCKSEQKPNFLATFCSAIQQVSSSPPQKAVGDVTFSSSFRDGMKFTSHDYRHPVDVCLISASHSGPEQAE